jgi:hypothetical protein
LSFPLSGPGATPGVITMLLDDTAGPRLDGQYSSITVVFNASPQPVAQSVPALAGANLALHPVQSAGADPVVCEAVIDTGGGNLIVPPRTVAVFVTT